MSNRYKYANFFDKIESSENNVRFSSDKSNECDHFETNPNFKEQEELANKSIAENILNAKVIISAEYSFSMLQVLSTICSRSKKGWGFLIKIQSSTNSNSKKQTKMIPNSLEEYSSLSSITKTQGYGKLSWIRNMNST